MSMGGMRTQSLLRSFVVCWGAVLTVLAGASWAPAQAAVASSDGGQLRGRAFQVSSVEVNSVPQRLFSTARLRLSFVEDRVEVSASCGAVASRVDLRGGRLVLLDAVTVPPRCSGEDLQRFSWVLWDLRTGPQWSLEGSALTLLSSGGERIRLLDVAAATVEVTVSEVPFPTLWG